MDGINRTAIRDMIAAKSLTIRALSIKTGFTEATLRNFLSGKTPSYKLVQSLITALEMDRQTALQVFFTPDLPDAD